MKKEYFTILLVVFMALITSWNKKKFDETKTESISVVHVKKMIYAGGDFDKLVSFIEKNSYAVFPAENSVLCNYQCIFYDSDKRMNLGVITKRDSLGNPSLDGKVGKVDVRIYRSARF